MRQILELKTVERNYQANGCVEKAVDLIRRLACTLLDMMRAKTGYKIELGTLSSHGILRMLPGSGTGSL